jgi:hypothetical protein
VLPLVVISVMRQGTATPRCRAQPCVASANEQPRNFKFQAMRTRLHGSSQAPHVERTQYPECIVDTLLRYKYTCPSSHQWQPATQAAAFPVWHNSNKPALLPAVRTKQASLPARRQSWQVRSGAAAAGSRPCVQHMLSSAQLHCVPFCSSLHATIAQQGCQTSRGISLQTPVRADQRPGGTAARRHSP